MYASNNVEKKMLKPRLSKGVMRDGVAVQTIISADLYYWLKSRETNLPGFIRQLLKDVTAHHKRDPVDVVPVDAPDKLESQRVLGLMYYPDFQYWNDELKYPISSLIRTLLTRYYEQKIQKKPVKLSQAELDEIDAEIEEAAK